MKQYGTNGSFNRTTFMMRGRKTVAWSMLLVVALAAFFVWQQPYRTCLRLAAREYLAPTTIELMPLMAGCSQVHEAPPDTLMKIIETQWPARIAGLQKIFVCRSSQPFPQEDPAFTTAAFSEQTRSQWLPLYEGCCIYQFRRHINVVVAQNDAEGSVVAIAVMSESRWNYLRFLRWHCDEKLQAWLQ